MFKSRLNFLRFLNGHDVITGVLDRVNNHPVFDGFA